MGTIRKKRRLTYARKEKTGKKRMSSTRRTRRYRGGQKRQQCIETCNLKYDEMKPKVKPTKPRPPLRTGNKFGYLKIR